MGILFNRSKVPALTEMMLEQIDKWIVCLSLAKIKGPIDLGPSCRALESDIICACSRYYFSALANAST